MQYPQYQQHPQQSCHVALPTVWPTILVTFFLGLFGLIPAIMHTNRAKQAGRPTSNYWVAFGCTTAANVLLWVIVFSSMAASVPAYY